MPKLPKPHQFIHAIALIAFAGLYSFALDSFAQDPAPADPAAAPAADAPPPEKPIYASTTERDNTMLANANPKEILWLETPTEKFLALFKPGETRKTKGSLLILHAPELPQLWPAPLENLRRNLPIYGWETITIPLPQKYATATPARDNPDSANSTDSQSSSSETASAQSSSASSEAAKPREQIISERVDAGVKQLNKAGQFNLVVLVDNSSAAYGLQDLYKKINVGTSTPDTIDGPLQALIIVNLQGQEPLTKEQLESIFSVENLPIMDVFFDPETPYQLEVRRLHHAVALRKNINDYQQLVLPPEHVVAIDDKQNFWLEKVRGFMERKAEGTELKGKSP